jgi:hypothetical protein
LWRVLKGFACVYFHSLLVVRFFYYLCYFVRTNELYTILCESICSGLRYLRGKILLKQYEY